MWDRECQLYSRAHNRIYDIEKRMYSLVTGDRILETYYLEMMTAPRELAVVQSL